MYKPIVSVIMSVFNEPIDWIKQSIDSILQQTFSNFEFIIVLDSPENFVVENLIQSYMLSDKRVQLIKNPSNIGLTKSLNKALEVAKGEYIARMDADDVSMPNRLERQYNYLCNNSNRLLCFSNYAVINENGDIVNPRVKGKIKPDNTVLFWQNIYPHPTAMFSKTLLNLRAPLYNEQYIRSQDYELWSFLFLNNVYGDCLDDVLLHYRHSSNQITKKNGIEQNQFFLSARRKFILSFLSSRGIVVKTDDKSKDILDAIRHSYISIAKCDLTSFQYILFLLYYSVSIDHKYYILLYLFDKHKLVSHFSIRDTRYIIALLFNINKNPGLVY